MRCVSASFDHNLDCAIFWQDSVFLHIFNSVREYENVQIQVYLRMLGLMRAKLIEQYNNTTATQLITRDEEIWDNNIWPGLLDFAIDLHARATGQIEPSA